MSSTRSSRVKTYGVRGLMCANCLVLLIDRVRNLPRVRSVTVDLVTDGESSLTVAPADAASPEEIRALVDDAGFEYVAQRRRRVRRWAEGHCKAGPRFDRKAQQRWAGSQPDLP